MVRSLFPQESIQSRGLDCPTKLIYYLEVSMTTKCSCVICKNEFSINGFHSHFERSHITNYGNTHKFLLFCSCIICKEEVTVQSLSNHIERHENELKIKSYCKQCNTPIYKNRKSFCNSSCAATYSNRRKDYSKIKLGPPKGTKPKHYAPRTKISVCIICGKFHPRSGKTCSKDCNRKFLSIRIRESKYDFQQNRGRHKKSYLEQSFEDWLISNNYTNFIPEEKFKNKEERKTYYADFYFPEKKLIIELDGSQHKNTKDADAIRDAYITNEYDLTIIRISHKEYINKSRIEEIKSLLGMEIQRSTN